MTTAARVREQICLLGERMDRLGLSHGSSGNISARLPDGTILVSPTGTRLGELDPARLAHLDCNGRQLSGDAPTKEVALHTAFYATREAGAVLHLHSTHSVALSILPETRHDCVLPPVTAYSVMLLGKVPLLPYFRPGDPAMGDAVRNMQGKSAAVLLAHHGPVVAGRDLFMAGNMMEELEATARLAVLLQGQECRHLSSVQIADLRQHFDADWEEC